MKDEIVPENRMLRDPVEESLEHARPTRNERGVLASLGRSGGELGNGRLVRDGRDDKSWVKLGERGSEGFELRVTTTSLDGLGREGERQSRKARADPSKTERLTPVRMT